MFNVVSFERNECTHFEGCELLVMRLKLLFLKISLQFDGSYNITILLELVGIL